MFNKEKQSEDNIFSLDNLRHRTPVILFLMEKISTVFRQTVVS